MIVLSITILVLAILTATAIIALEDTGIIGRSKSAASKREYDSEYEYLITVKNKIQATSLGMITVDEYIAELKQLGMTDSDGISNSDGSKTITTKNGFYANIIQENEANIIISLGTKDASIVMNPTVVTGDITSGYINKTINITTTNVLEDVVWTTSNPSVVTVNGSNSGATLTLKTPGTATVTATYGEAKASCNVEVTGTVKTPLITLNKSTITTEIRSGQQITETLTATTQNISGTLIWTTSNSNVATVTGSGNTGTVTIKSPGTAVITAKNGKTTAKCTVIVSEKIITGSTPLVANRPFTISDYSCTVEWASSTAEYTIACDAMDKDYNPVYILKAGMTKEEYDAMGLKFRKGSWIYIGYGTYVSEYDKYYYSTGEILDTYARTITANKCPMFQVNGDGTIAVNTESTLKSPNSSYTTENSSVYSTVTNVDVFRELNSSDQVYTAANLVMFDGAALTSQAGSYVLPYILKLEMWSQIANRNFIPGSLIFANYDMPGRLVKVHSEDGFNVYVVAE